MGPLGSLTAEEIVRVTGDRRRADDWSLALASAGIESRLDWTSEGSVVVVRAADRARAAAVLAAFDAENQPPPQPPPDAFEPRASRTAVIVAVLLCAFFVVTGPRDAGRAWWFERGGSVAWRIAEGETWRTVTALTLHADFLHVLSNALTMVIFGSALCGLVGAGTGLWIMLLSGAAGNWVTAALRGAPYSAVGASTAIFGGLGALAMLQLARRRRGARVSPWHAAAPVAAALGLLGFLGTSPQSDVLAHLFGFAIGTGLGALVIRVPTLRDRPRVQTALAIAAALAVLACWLFAWLG